MLSYEDYTVAIVCPIDFEMSAVRYMLDKQHDDLPPKQGDPNSYILGELSGHRVALACLPGLQGKGSAAVVATNLARSFPSIKWRFLVGIGGGVPHDGDHDIRLGDVVVGMPEGAYGGVVQYDLGKDKDGDVFTRKGYLEMSPSQLRSAIMRMRSDHYDRGNQIQENITAMLERSDRIKAVYQRPAAETDVLFNAEYLHLPDRSTCLDCDVNMIVKRPPRSSESPEIHYGLIASGDRVLRSAAKRAKEIRQVGEDILCFEMEAAGLMTEFSGLVVRGISDYADSHKNDGWQHYAAAAAAACVKELLSRVYPEQQQQQQQQSIGSGFGQTLPLPLGSGPAPQHFGTTLSGQGVVNSGSGNFGVGRDFHYSNM
ncbi:hypothetical protein PG993_006266 [Apiospora rasikravindrae]|uniref:Nucleoside phosphorylase domain-containing protein n=1 Tax=Apiospora rasikravindrae TaxID=990691 RepID=A0ABR1T581_9PEZI